MAEHPSARLPSARLPSSTASISAAIFVPIPASTNLLSPPGFSPNSPEYHRAALDVVARHEARVRDNLEALFQREMLRISIDAPAANSDFDYFAATAAVRARGEAALRRDCEAMLANMREPDGPSVQHNVNVIPTPKMDSVPVTYAPIMSPRELAARDVMKVIAAATQELSGFDNHVKCMRDAIKKQIQQSALQIGSQSDPMDID
ncbi:hypothetical protein Trco_000264 [Trichoderma cornu-damae]|uniref:Uncharacterized protein n=1 Tax=Trichoderma cornu-damae TaxID=654480 RepID=A0A9P8QS16_9HYPO|nr:hypothetical protein Trco_000264 [Trichoderma cornu-damae]